MDSEISKARMALLRHLSHKAKEQGITQEQLEDRTGIARSNISRMLSGKKSISLDTYLKLTKAVGFILPSDPS